MNYHEARTAYEAAKLAKDHKLTKAMWTAMENAHEAVEPKGDAPSGRTVVTGTVLSLKDRETDFGIVTKMLVKLDNGAKVWATAPADVERGDRIEVRATWTVSKDDKSFAFGARPFLISRTPAAVTT